MFDFLTVSVLLLFEKESLNLRPCDFNKKPGKCSLIGKKRKDMSISGEKIEYF